MTDCDKINPLLSRYLAGELTERERYSVEKHLTLCSSCAYELRYFEAIEHSLRQIERTPMPRAVELRILAKLPLLTGWEPPMYAVVAAAVFLGVVIGAWSYVINFQLLQPAIDFFRMLYADFWAWSGNHAPSLANLMDYLSNFSLFYVFTIAGISGFILYKIGEQFIYIIMGRHAVALPVKRAEKR